MEKTVSAAGAFVADVLPLLRDPGVAEFCGRLADVPSRAFRKSWLGINFRGSEPLGLKVYFTFYERLDADALARVLPEAEMRSDFLEHAVQASPEHTTNPWHPGSGFTFCLKVDRRGEPTWGYHFRVGQGGTGVFRLFGARTHTKEYAYVIGTRAKAALAERFGLPFLCGCETIEHGRGCGHGFESDDADEKVIPIGDFRRLGPLLFDDGERATVAAVEGALGVRAVCGGVYRNGVKSFYLAGDRDGDRVRTVEPILAGRAIACP